jgi:hypothetical protein
MTPAVPAVPTLRSFPGSSRLLIVPSGGRNARHVRTLAGSSDWRRGLVDRVGSTIIAISGPRHLRTAPAGWQWPDLSFEQITAALQPSLPGIRLLGAALPRQLGRRRLSMLCRYAGNSIVLKLGVDDSATSLRVEADVLRLLTLRPIPGIATPELISVGSFQPESTTADSAITFVATTAIGLTSQRAAIDVRLRTFGADLAERLAPLPKPETCLADAVPIHGDLTPWNLRRTSRGLALFDWESASWGAAGSDMTTYRSACDQVRPFWRSLG